MADTVTGYEGYELDNPQRQVLLAALQLATHQPHEVEAVYVNAIIRSEIDAILIHWKNALAQPTVIHRLEVPDIAWMKFWSSIGMNNVQVEYTNIFYRKGPSILLNIHKPSMFKDPTTPAEKVGQYGMSALKITDPMSLKSLLRSSFRWRRDRDLVRGECVVLPPAHYDRLIKEAGYVDRRHYDEVKKKEREELNEPK